MTKSRRWKMRCAIFSIWAATTIAVQAQTYTNLVHFNGVNGGYPNGPLVQGTDGDFYGTAFAGGGHGPCGSSLRCGTFFGMTGKISMTISGGARLLLSFCTHNLCQQGGAPFGGLVLGSDTNFYGTTSEGGAYNQGTIYEVNSHGIRNTLHNFCSDTPNCTDGRNPEGSLTQADDGNFYGTTANGGKYGGGVVFKIAPDGTFTLLYTFCQQGGLVRMGKIRPRE